MAKKTKKEIDREIDAEFEAKSKEELLADFVQSEALHVPARKSESKLISIRLPMSMIKGLRDVAIKKGDIGYQQLIKIFIAEGLSHADVILNYDPKPSAGMIASTYGSSQICHVQPAQWISGDYPKIA